MRSRTLDILRCVAVLTVLGRHMTVCPSDVSAVLHEITTVWKRGGWVGVDLFFVLSGFLISGLLFREHQKYGSISFRSFFLRRGLKIYPAFYFVILVTIMALLLRRLPVPAANVLHELLFIQNYREGLWNHTWSLAIEEHFYILLPIALIVSLRVQKNTQQPFRWIPRAFLWVATACLAVRVATALLWPYRDRLHHFATHLRLDSLFCGVAVSYFYHYHSERFAQASRRHRPYLLPVGLLCFAPPFYYEVDRTPALYTFGFALLWFGSALLLFCLVPEEPPANVPVRALAFAGSRSYSIYLWHMPVAAWGIGAPMRFLFGGFNWYFYIVAYLIGAFAVGLLMASLIEYPVLRLRDRLFPSRSQAMETT